MDVQTGAETDTERLIEKDVVPNVIPREVLLSNNEPANAWTQTEEDMELDTIKETRSSPFEPNEGELELSSPNSTPRKLKRKVSWIDLEKGADSPVTAVHIADPSNVYDRRPMRKRAKGSHTSLEKTLIVLAAIVIVIMFFCFLLWLVLLMLGII
jgi:hypothetical protein